MAETTDLLCALSDSENNPTAKTTADFIEMSNSFDTEEQSSNTSNRKRETFSFARFRAAVLRTPPRRSRFDDNAPVATSSKNSIDTKPREVVHGEDDDEVEAFAEKPRVCIGSCKNFDVEKYYRWPPEQLYLHGRGGNDDGATILALAEVLKTDTTLTTLYVCANFGNRDIFAALVEALKTNTTLTTVNLTATNVDDKVRDTIWKSGKKPIQGKT